MHDTDLDPKSLVHFGFTGTWVEQGVLTRLVLDKLCAQWAEGADTNLEHYRWSAFEHFLRANTTLTPTQFDCL